MRDRRPPGDLPEGLPDAAAAAGAPDDGAEDPFVGRAMIRIVTRCWPGARAAAGAGGAAADDDDDAPWPPSLVARFRTCWRRAARLGMESSPPGPPDKGPDDDERRVSPLIPPVPDEPADDEDERRLAVAADDERCRCCLRAATAALIPAIISVGLGSMGLPGLLTSLPKLCRLPAREGGEPRAAAADALPAVLREAGASLSRMLSLGSVGRGAVGVFLRTFATRKSPWPTLLLGSPTLPLTISLLSPTPPVVAGIGGRAPSRMDGAEPLLGTWAPSRMEAILG